MKPTAPPRIATWLLEHSTPGPRNEALAGDLLEEFRQGRSAAWYWRQVLAAIAIACFRETLDRRTMLLFAVLWSILAPGWDLLIENVEHNPALFGPMWTLAWPWSTFAALGLSLLIGGAFIWTGVLVYLLLYGAMTLSFSLRGLRRTLALSLSAFIAISAAMFALTLLLPVTTQAMNGLGLNAFITPSAPKYEKQKNIYRVYRFTRQIDPQTGKSVVVRALVDIDSNDFYPPPPAPAPPTPLSEIKNTNTRAIVARLPYFLSMIYALWGLSRLEKRRRTMA
jgi:hypothetical protein